MQFYFNPLDTACKNVVGGVREGEILQLNIFCLKDEVDVSEFYGEKGVFCPKTPALADCIKPANNAFLRLNRDGESTALFPMKITAMTTPFSTTG